MPSWKGWSGDLGFFGWRKREGKGREGVGSDDRGDTGARLDGEL